MSLRKKPKEVLLFKQNKRPFEPNKYENYQNNTRQQKQPRTI